MCERAGYIGKLASYAILACLLLINDEAVAALAAKLFAICHFGIMKSAGEAAVAEGEET